MIALYPQFTALDCVGPYDILSRLPGARVRWGAAETGVVRADAGLGIAAEAFVSLPQPDVVLIPGGMRVPDREQDADLFSWLASVHPHTTWTVSVCSGALVLGELGLLDGLEAATHWSAFEMLEDLGTEPSSARFVVHGDQRIATAAGVSAGLDLALVLAEALSDRRTAEAIQLAIEYDPQPPLSAGAVAAAPESRKRLALTRLEESVVQDRGFDCSPHLRRSTAPGATSFDHLSNGSASRKTEAAGGVEDPR